MYRFARGADGKQPGSDHMTYGISLIRDGEVIWHNMVEINGSAILRELILARLEALSMREKQRYLAKMQSQHIRVRVPWASAYEQVAKAEPFCADTHEEFEPVSANLLSYLHKLLFRRNRTLA